MQISFEKLVKAAPFDEESKKSILDKLSTLSDDQKFRLTETAWKLIAIQFMAKLKEKSGLLLLEISQGKKPYNKNDFIEIEVSLYSELADKFETTEKEQGISQVREELSKYMPQFTIDKTVIPENSSQKQQVQTTQGTPKKTEQ